MLRLTSLSINLFYLYIVFISYFNIFIFFYYFDVEVTLTTVLQLMYPIDSLLVKTYFHCHFLRNNQAYRRLSSYQEDKTCFIFYFYLE